MWNSAHAHVYFLNVTSSFMWVIGAIIAAAGMQVYIVWGSVR